MTKDLTIPGHYRNGLLILVSISGLYFISAYNYLLFHSIAEVFSIVIAGGIFMVAWNTRRIVENDYLLFLGIAYVFIALLDSLHTLTYPGIGIIRGNDLNIPVQLWIAARFLEAATLLIAPFVLGQKLNLKFMITSYTAVTMFFIMSIFSWGIFPDCFIEGTGLTTFKKTSEYVISLILLASIFTLSKKRDRLDRDLFRLLIASIAVTISAELAFTFYISFFGFSNFVGHIFKIVSFYLIYKAVIEGSLTKPYDILFRDLKQSRQELINKQQLNERLIDALPYQAMLISKDKKVLAANLTAKDAGAKVGDYCWKSFGHSEFIAEEDKKYIAEHNKAPDHCVNCYFCKANESIANNTHINIDVPKGDRIWDTHWIPLEKETYLYLASDVTDRKRVEDELLRHREHLMDLVDERTHELKTSYQKLEKEFMIRKIAEKNAKLMALFAELDPAPVLRVNTVGEVIMANAAAIEILDIDPHNVHLLSGMLPGAEDLDILECIKNNSTLSHTTEIGERSYYFIIRGIADLAIGQVYGTDITEQKRAEAEMLRSSQLALMGEVAAGVAHEVNNPINGIINYATIMANRSSPESEEHDIAARIIKESNRIAEIVKGLLFFARDSKGNKHPVNIINIMSDSLGLVGTQMRKEGIRFSTLQPSGPSYIMADPQRIEQVFLNILRNARYALNQKYTGSDKDKALEIYYEETIIDDQPFIRTVFHDKGIGIPKEIMDKITDSFFSTKPHGIGTGLGLSISNTIVSDHGGNLLIESSEGEFTKVMVDLPLVAKEPEGDAIQKNHKSEVKRSG